jgi:signal transduction histidine kinase
MILAQFFSLDNIQLAVTNLTYIIGIFFTVVFGIVVYLKSSRHISHITFLLMTLALAITEISHLIGINVTNGEASQAIFMFSLSQFFVIAFTVHWILAVLKKDKEKKTIIAGIYAFSSIVCVYFILNPIDFLLTSVPKMYLANYYEPGKLYWTIILFFTVSALYVTYQLVYAYIYADSQTKNRIRYFLSSLWFGYGFTPLAFFLAYNVQLDPIYSAVSALYVVPLAYGILKYDLMDIRVVAKRALTYAIIIGSVGLGIGAINLANTWLLQTSPDFPDWLIPLVSSIGAVLIGGFVWERLRELDVLKYEFITVVTHKFRTPLTRIKWATEFLRKGPDDSEKEEAVQEIERADELLVELTDTLIGLSKAEDSSYMYSFEEFNISERLSKILNLAKNRISNKGLKISTSIADNLPHVQADARRLYFVLQILIENAIAYTPQGGFVNINVTEDRSWIRIEIQDNGIGVSKEDLPRIFSKFFRSASAKKADTEGMGIGLFMVKQIIERHDGTVCVKSDGLDKGATFIIKLPFVRHVEEN